jgi:predicted acylesterase/phospholipase RssA
MWLLFVSVLLPQALAQSCRVLVLGGGTDRGAYQAGAVMGLVAALPAGEAQWDAVVGTGVGAINAVFVSQAPKGTEPSLAAKLGAFWANFTATALYRDWTGGIVTGLLVESGLYDTAPMKKLIASLQTNSPSRFLGVGATDLMSSSYVFFNSTVSSISTLNTGVLASAADYFWFPYVDYQNFKLSTGSIKDPIDIFHGISHCTQQGFSQNQITVDVVMTAGKSLEKVDAAKYKTPQVLYRTFDIMYYQSAMLIINNTQYDFPNVNLRTVIFPTAKLEGPFAPYDYTKAELAYQIQLGQEDAQKAVLRSKMQTK